ncbi:putative brain protein I3 [Daphnia sinensis]|uniref:Brain protein I3 n=1 Tax=Daphnia sinensis TaxID=1820382 RepID=A0AAD5PPD2_9CRUS|nr:putative brain protein I3 [Daphnia sinensis]
MELLRPVIADGLHCSAIDHQLPTANSKKLILTRIAKPVQVHQAHSIIYSTANPREDKIETVDTSGSDSEVACDELCSHCNVGVVEKNFTFSGVLLCLICFPFGFIWLFWMMESQCNHCGKIYL